MKNYIIAALVVLVIILSYLLFINLDKADAPGAEQSATPQDTSTAAGKTTNLSSSGLENVDTKVFEDKSIVVLNVSDNNLTGALPSQIGKLTNLEVLLANNNQLAGIPAEIGQLSKLRIVNFANNDITGLPLEIGNLKNLETLDLRGNPNVSTYDISKIQPQIPNAKILTD